MKSANVRLCATLLVVSTMTFTVFRTASAQEAVPMLINYQGELRSPATGEPVPDGSYKMVFRIFDAQSGGTELWHGAHSGVSGNPVEVVGGIFSVILGSGAGNIMDASVFNGPDRWLEISVGTEPLSPRQRITSSAYSLVSEDSRLLGGKEPSEYLMQAQGFRLESNDTSPNVIGGHEGNEVTAGVVGATIGGGGDSDHANLVTDDYGTISGGLGNEAEGWCASVGAGAYNTASEEAATVGGGVSNTASGYMGTVGGGYSNTASARYATVGGGEGNTASGYAATVGGGYSNTASGSYATVPGGRSNTAAGDYSFAAGRRAKANHNGSFVLADSIYEDFASVRDNALRVRFNGGATFVINNSYWVRFWTTGTRVIDVSNGAYLSTGGAWTNASDRNAKENFAPVEGEEVLSRLAEVPIQSWNYKAEDPSVRRMGPTAQDFYAAFGLGEDERHIASLDANGVALAAIQGLDQVVEKKERRISALEKQNAALEARVAKLEALVETLTKEGKGAEQ